MEIRWLGTAAAEIACQGKHILIDPYFQKTPKAAKAQEPVMREAIRRADVILITHPHMDHFSDIGRVVRLTDVHVCVAPRGIATAEKKKINVSSLRPIRDGMTISVCDGLAVRVWASRHVKFDKALEETTKRRAFLPQNFPRGLQIWFRNRAFSMTDDDIFAFEINGEGKTVFVLGSANLREDIDYPKGADMLLFPYQGRSDIAEYSVPIIERLDPKSVLLTHFDDAFPPVSQRMDTRPFCDKFPNAREPEFNVPVIL